jgi:hypothetical protein
LNYYNNNNDKYLYFVCFRERISRAAKAKDQYGPVIAIVEKKRRELAQDGITDIHHNETGGMLDTKVSDDASGNNKGADTSLALFS